MALKAVDGYDHYAAAADLKSRNGFIQYQQPGTNATPISFPVGRDGFGKAMSLDQDLTNTYIVFGDRNVEAIVGFALSINGTGGTGGGVDIIFWDSVTGLTQIELYFNPLNYTTTLYRGARNAQSNGQPNGTIIGASANNAWSGNVWMFVEVDLKIGSSGSIEVRINNETVYSFTGNTVGPSTTGPIVAPGSTWDIMSIIGTNLGGSSSTKVDDLYYCDTTTGPGTFPCDSFLGDCKVDTVFADGNASVTWTPLANTNWQEVKEVVFDGDLTYNFTSTPGNEDLLNFGPLDPLVTAVIGVQVTGAYRKDDAGSRTLKQGIKSGATTGYGATRNLPDSYVYWSDMFVLNPDTSATWTKTEVDAASAGYNLVS